MAEIFFRYIYVEILRDREEGREEGRERSFWVLFLLGKGGGAGGRGQLLVAIWRVFHFLCFFLYKFNVLDDTTHTHTHILYHISVSYIFIVSSTITT